MTLTKELCQNCFRDCNKAAVGSNFCCQQCFDEWILKQQSKVINAFNAILFPEIEGREEKKYELPLAGRIH